MNAEAAHALARVQVAMWLPAWCSVCGDEYVSVDDFEARRVRATDTFPDPRTGFVDDDCLCDGPRHPVGVPPGDIVRDEVEGK